MDNTKLYDLRLQAEKFAEKMDALYKGKDSPEAMDLTDAAIDEWNVLINRAPQALKAAKLGLLATTTGTAR